MVILVHHAGQERMNSGTLCADADDSRRDPGDDWKKVLAYCKRLHLGSVMLPGGIACGFAQEPQVLTNGHAISEWRFVIGWIWRIEFPGHGWQIAFDRCLIVRRGWNRSVRCLSQRNPSRRCILGISDLLIGELTAAGISCSP